MMNEQDKRIQSRILNVLNSARLKGAGKLSKDSISAVIALEDLIALHQSMMQLLLEGDLEAQYDGQGDTARGDVDMYSFRSTPQGDAKAKS